MRYIPQMMAPLHSRARCIILLIGEAVLVLVEVRLILLNSYYTGIFGIAEDASSNATVLLSLDSTFGLVP